MNRHVKKEINFNVKHYFPIQSTDILKENNNNNVIL